MNSVQFKRDFYHETSYGKNVGQLVVRPGENIGLSPLINKNGKTKQSSLKDDLLICNHTPSLDDFNILNYDNNKNLSCNQRKPFNPTG